MAIIISAVPRAPGFGAQRLLVRGERALPLPVAALLREQYNEYPERGGLPFGYPAPGRRGPSRAPAIQGAAAPRPDTGGETYPPQLPRDDRDTGYVSPVPAVVFDRVGLGGDSSIRFRQPAAGVTEVTASRAIVRPFVLTQVNWFCDTSHNNSGGTVKISLDNNTAGGINTSGQRVPDLGPDGRSVPAVVGSGFYTPRILWRQVPAFIKLVLENNSAGFITFVLWVDIEYLQ